MKKGNLMLIACICILSNLFSQSINLSTNTLSYTNNKIMGFNPARAWAGSLSNNSQNGYTGLINDLSLEPFNNLNIQVLRFPGGTLADGYHRYRNGFGLREDENNDLDFFADPSNTDLAYDLARDEQAVNDPTFYNAANYIGWNNPKGGNNNIIFPYIQYVKKLNADKNGDGIMDNNIKAHCVVNVVSHFCFRDNLRNELFNNVDLIGNINNINDLENLKNQGLISDAFYFLVIENFEMVQQLHANIGVVAVEIGNELANEGNRTTTPLDSFKMSTKLSVLQRKLLNKKVWTTQDVSSIQYYAALVKMYSNLIKNSIDNSIKIGIPVSEYVSANETWNNYLAANVYDYYNAIVMHSYFSDYTPSTIDQNLSNDFSLCNELMKNYFANGVLGKIIGINSLPVGLNKKIWFSEFGIKYDNKPVTINRSKFANTLLDGIFQFEYLLNFMELNAAPIQVGTFTVNRPIESFCHHLTIDEDLSGSQFPTYELANHSYTNTQSPKVRAAYLAYQLTKDLFKDSIFKITSHTGIDFGNTNTNVNTKLYYKKGDPNNLTDGGTIYLAYDNKSATDIAANLANLNITGNDIYTINGMDISYAYANKLYASLGTTAFMNDETLYQNNLDKTIKIVENQIINSFTGFNYRANSFGIIKITLNYTEGTGGNSCSYLKFTNTGGAGDYVNIPYKNAIQNLHTGNFTIEMNVRGLTNTNYMVLFSNAIQQFHPFKNNITIAYNRFGTNNKIEFWQNNKKYAFNLCKNLNDNNWHHLAIVKSGTKMYCFIDNPIPCGTTTYSIAGYLPPVVADWSIGGGNKYKPTGTTTLGSYFGTTGDIDEVRIWKIARTGNELMSSAYLDITPTDPNLVAYWKFNDNTQTVTDAKSLANGTLGLNTTMANDDPSYQTSGCGGSRLMSQELPIIEKVFITKESLKVFPNPSSPSQIKFEFLSLTQQNAIIQIFDVQGKQLMLKNSLLSEGIQNIETDLALIDQKGMFFISVQTDKERFLQNFILQ